VFYVSLKQVMLFKVVSYSALTSHTQKLKLLREGDHFTYSSTLPFTCNSRRTQMRNRRQVQFIFDKLCPPGFELETFDSDTMLATMH
jgi:hypothetical protein